MTEPARAIKAVCDYYAVPARRLLDGGKTPRAARPRAVAMWLLRHHAGLSFPAIASALGMHHHTSVMDGCARVEAREELLAATEAMLTWLGRVEHREAA